MNNIFGNRPVFGDDFYGRDKFVRHLQGILLSRNSFLLLGLRRTGKSSVLAEVNWQIGREEPEIILLNLNCQTLEGIQDFYKQLYLTLPKTWKDKFRSILKDSKRFPGKVIDFITDHVEEVNVGDWGSVKFRNEVISYAEGIKEELSKFFKSQKAHIILFIDELPFLFENIELKNSAASKTEIEMVLTTLRSWREIGISQAICGSLNLHLQLESIGISRKLLAGVSTQNLPKFTIEETKGMLQKLAGSDDIELSGGHLDRIISLHPDCIPQFLQYFYFNLKTHWDGTMEGVDLIFNKYVYPGIVRDFEYQFNERFARIAEADIPIVKKLFDLIYNQPLITESEMLNAIRDEGVYRILLLLASQEFIVMDENQRYDFSFEIVRNWWKKKN